MWVKTGSDIMGKSDTDVSSNLGIGGTGSIGKMY
jgi:hypothetical protein